MYFGFVARSEGPCSVPHTDFAKSNAVSVAT